jgi:hypothetical protein
MRKFSPVYDAVRRHHACSGCVAPQDAHFMRLGWASQLAPDSDHRQCWSGEGVLGSSRVFSTSLHNVKPRRRCHAATTRCTLVVTRDEHAYAHPASLQTCCRDATADLAGPDALADFYLQPHAKPSTTPTKPLPPSPNPTSSKPVVLFRDSNAWCPFCQKSLDGFAREAHPVRFRDHITGQQAGVVRRSGGEQADACCAIEWQEHGRVYGHHAGTLTIVQVRECMPGCSRASKS